MLANKMFRRLSHNPDRVQTLVRRTFKCNSIPDQQVAGARPSVVHQCLVIVGKKGKIGHKQQRMKTLVQTCGEKIWATPSGLQRCLVLAVLPTHCWVEPARLAVFTLWL